MPRDVGSVVLRDIGFGAATPIPNFGDQRDLPMKFHLVFWEIVMWYFWWRVD